MSTDYRLNNENKVSFAKFKQAVIECNLKIAKGEGDTEVAVTDGTQYMWFYFDREYNLTGATRYGANYDAPETILEPISTKLDVEFIGEHEDGYFLDEDSNEEE